MSCLPEKGFPLRSRIIDDARLQDRPESHLTGVPVCAWDVRPLETGTIDNTSTFNRKVNGFVYLTVDTGEKAVSSEDEEEAFLAGLPGPLSCLSCSAWPDTQPSCLSPLHSWKCLTAFVNAVAL